MTHLSSQVGTAVLLATCLALSACAHPELSLRSPETVGSDPFRFLDDEQILHGNSRKPKTQGKLAAIPIPATDGLRYAEANPPRIQQVAWKDPFAAAHQNEVANKNKSDIDSPVIPPAVVQAVATDADTNAAGSFQLASGILPLGNTTTANRFDTGAYVAPPAAMQAAGGVPGPGVLLMPIPGSQPTNAPQATTPQDPRTTSAAVQQTNGLQNGANADCPPCPQPYAGSYPGANWCPPGMNGYGLPANGFGAQGMGNFQGLNAYGQALPVAIDPRSFPDEYLCDGGDRGPSVRYSDTERLGLETEDTVVEFLDHTGKFHMQPTNRVCVYAPRFRSMSTVELPTADTGIRSLASADRLDAGTSLQGELAIDSKVKDLPPEQIDVRSRPSEMENQLAGVGFEQRTRIEQKEHLLSGHFLQLFLSTGEIRDGREGWLAESVTAAAGWSKAEFPVITGSRKGTNIVRHVFRLQELIGTEVKGPGELRIVKLADKQTAQVGDILTFTLRYDNVGEAELLGIRIVDNLTPRLEYIADSETSDRPGSLTVTDNAEGSVVLTFELDDPLQAKKGGVITFKTRVR